MNQGSSRRRFLVAAAAAAALPALPAMARLLPAERSIGLLNLHTGESVRGPYWLDAAPVAEIMAQIRRVLRDHRTGEEREIDGALLDQLAAVATTLGKAPFFHVISGYRSPATNAMLHAQSAGVADGSLHVQGRAIDIRVPGVGLAALRRAALALRAGGVGFYPKSDFVHLDTGRVRAW